MNADGYGLYKDVTSLKHRGLLKAIGASYDGVFDDGPKQAKRLAAWWADNCPECGKQKLPYRIEQTRKALQKILDAQEAKAPLPDIAALFHTIADQAYYGKNFATPQMRKRSDFAQPGAKEILSVAKADFVKGVYVSPRIPNTLNIITETRIIKRTFGDCMMGEYRISLDLSTIPTVHIHAHNNRKYVGGNQIHPHARWAGGCCMGEVGMPIRNHLATGMLFEAVSLVCFLLTTHNYGGYRDAMYWKKDSDAVKWVCTFGQHNSGRNFSICGHCGARHCGDCKTKLMDGKKAMCLFCGRALPRIKKRKPKTEGTKNEQEKQKGQRAKVRRRRVGGAQPGGDGPAIVAGVNKIFDLGG